MHILNVLPPSNDRKTSISHHDRSTLSLGNNASHSTLTFCPGKTTSPACGETSLAAYEPLPSGAAVEVLSNCGAKANATANNVTTNPRVFIFSPPFDYKECNRGIRDYVSSIFFNFCR